MKKKYNKKRYKELTYKYPLVLKTSDFEARFPNIVQAINKNFGLTFKSSILIYILVSICLTLVSFYLQPTSLIKINNIFIGNNSLIFLLNFLPIFLITSFIGTIFNNPFFASTITSILLFTASLANKYKIAYRDEPFKLSDLSMAKEGSSAVLSMNYNVNKPLIISLIVTCVILLICSFIYRVRHKYIKTRLVFVALLIATCLSLNSTIYSNSNLYKNIINGEITYHETDEFNNKGFIYSFVYSANNSVFAIPEFYSQDVATSLLVSEKEKTTEYSFKPNIIYILSEAFMDINDLENLSFDEGNYPLTNYKKILEDSIVYGDLIVPNFGGGTAYTEFEVLTGLNTTSLNFTNNPFESVTPKISSVPNILKQQGYKNTSVHPGDSWFYNRTTAYDILGFDKKIFNDEFTKEDYITEYISEEATYNKLINEISSNLNNNEPDFYNLVTIQNHGPYDGKYNGQEYSFDTSTEMNNLGKDITKNYLINLKDTDTQLKKLTDYLNSINEPFVIMYYGDHLPYLGPEYLVYKQAGWDLTNMNTPETAIKMHTTPYFIWANSAAKNNIDYTFVKQNNLKDIPISANYLPMILFETIGFKDITSYFNYSKDLFELINVYYKEIIIKDNTVLNDVDEIIKDVISKWKIMQYYFIQDEEVTYK